MLVTKNVHWHITELLLLLLLLLPLILLLFYSPLDFVWDYMGEPAPEK